MVVTYPALIYFLFALHFTGKPQDTILSPEQYIANYKDLAISEMKRTGVPASITLAQGLFESRNGNSYLARPPYNNHFGIKCKSDWTGRSVKVDDDELGECFRAYDNADDSYKDHSNFLSCQPRYAFLFKLEPTDYKSWAYGLKQAGYATNPQYPEKLIEKIEQYSLYQYDIGNTKAPVPSLAEKKPDLKIIQAQKATDNAFVFNNIPAYVVKPHDNIDTITNRRNMMRWEIRAYNDLESDDEIKPGTILYVKPKHRKGKQPFHTVKQGEGMYYISQDEGVKLRLLYKWNNMKPGQEPAPGQQINLQHKKIIPPALLAPGTVIPHKGVMFIQEPATGPKPDFNKCPPRDSDSSSVKTQTVTVTNHVFEYRPTAYDGTDSIGKYHIVQRGETIYGIAKNYGIQRDSLLKWNHFNVRVVEGDKIYLKRPKNFYQPDDPGISSGDNSKKANDDLPTDRSGAFYSVKQGDTLYSVSKKFNISIQQLKDWNGLSDNSISIGQKLKVGNE